MANIKFSAFTTETDDTQIDFLAGYQGTTMKKIAPNNITGAYPFKIETDSLYSGFVPGSLSGAPQDNTILGIRAGTGLTTGSANTLIGVDAGAGMTNVANSVVVGADAYKNNSAGYVTAIGQNCGVNATSQFSTFVGASSGFSGGANYQVAIGYEAMNSAAGGTGSVGVGRTANKSNTANYTVSIGYEAGYSNTSGS